MFISKSDFELWCLQEGLFTTYPCHLSMVVPDQSNDFAEDEGNRVVPPCVKQNGGVLLQDVRVPAQCVQEDERAISQHVEEDSDVEEGSDVGSDESIPELDERSVVDSSDEENANHSNHCLLGTRKAPPVLSQRWEVLTLVSLPIIPGTVRPHKDTGNSCSVEEIVSVLSTGNVASFEFVD